MTESSQASRALTIKDRVLALREYTPDRSAYALTPSLQRVTIESPQQPLSSNPAITIVCPVCNQALLPSQVQDHPHNTQYTPANYVRANPSSPNLITRYHVYIPAPLAPDNPVVAIVEYNPTSKLYRSHYGVYTHSHHSLNEALRSIESDSLATGQNLQISNW